MAKIKLTPEELLAQSAELTSLQTEFQTLFSQVTSALNSLNGSWSEALAGNFSGKIAAAQKSFSSVADMLQNGAAATRISAGGFAAPGTVLSMLCGGNVSSFDTLSELTGLDLSQAKEVMDKMAAGDFEGALEIAGEKGLDLLAGALAGDLSSDSWVGELQDATGGVLGLDGLEEAYFKNLFGNPIGDAADIVKDQFSGNPDYDYQLHKLGEMAWNIGPGAVIETGADAAFDAISKIPGVGEYYASKGVTDGEGAVSSMIGEITYMVTGDREAAAADAGYYEAHGGIASGIVDGVVNIGSFVGEKIGAAWHSAFGE